MEQESSVSEQLSQKEILEKTFELFFHYALSVLGAKKTDSLLKTTYESVQSYYPNISQIKLIQDHQIHFEEEEITEKEILGLAIWLQQFLTAIKNFMIGLGKVDAQSITINIHDQLEPLNFYEFFEQAKELSS